MVELELDDEQMERLARVIEHFGEVTDDEHDSAARADMDVIVDLLRTATGPFHVDVFASRRKKVTVESSRAPSMQDNRSERLGSREQSAGFRFP